MAGALLGVATADGEAWTRVWKSELLFAGCLSLATMTGRERLLWGSWWQGQSQEVIFFIVRGANHTNLIKI